MILALELLSPNPKGGGRKPNPAEMCRDAPELD